MMGVQNLVFHKTHFIFLFKKMFLFLRDLWRCFFPLFGFTGKYIFSFIRQKKNSNSKMIQHQEDQQNNEGKTELDNDKDVGEVKEEESEAVLRFHFPTYEEFLQNSNKKGQSLSYSSLCGNSDDKFVHVDAKDTIAKPKSSLDFSLIAKLEFSMGNDVFGSENHGIFLDESLHVGNIIENDDAKKNLKVENGEGLSEQMNDSTNDEDVLDNGSLFLDDDESLVNGTTSNEDVMKDSTHLRSHGESLVNGSTNDEDVMEDSTHLPSHGESLVNVTKNDEDVMEDSTHLPSHGESLVNVKTNDEDVMEYSTHLPSNGESLVNVTTNDEDVMEDSTHLRSHSESLVNVTKNDEYVMEDSNHLPTHGESLVNFTTNDEDVMQDSTHLLSHGESLVNVTTNNEDFMKYSTHLPSDNESLVSDSDSDTIAPSSESSFRGSFIDSLSDGFLSDVDFERVSEVDTPTEFGWDAINLTKEALEKEDLEFQNLSKGYEADDFDDEDEDILDELKNLESNLEGDNGDSNKKHEANTETKAENEQNDEKQSSGEQLSSDSDEQNGLETQWEHQDLVEQLKMEIKKVRAIGLPTILEEFETPKIMDDLKPWKIEEKYKLGGTLDELYKFYKSYKERMRKLDILNYQKMYAIGFLRLKDPLKSFSKNRISTTALSAIVSLDCWPFKPKLSTEINQPDVEKFSKELESDLEMVYVGQMCLSWELLRWQYGKALELWETDPHGVHLYNEVAGKFQTFQVLLTRFIEDERFQGPRVQNYVKKRCVQRNLLQVPLIRGDNTRDRRKEKKVVSSKEAITSLQLVEIIEESIRILWRFIKADKETSYIGLLKCRKSSNVELQNPADANLLEEIQSSLQKKEKKLRELLRSRNCILKKIQKHHQEEESYHVLYFFSQVDLRLVSRVLNMPRITTEQLVWCSDKLNNICLVDRKLHVDPAIVLLFPCS